MKGFCLAGTLLITVGTTAAQSPPVGPSPLQPLPSDTVQNQIRQARSSLFDHYAGPTGRLEDQDPKAPPVVTTHTVALVPELPAEHADTIVVGTIVGAQAYQSTNHTSIYTESLIAVERVIDSQFSSIGVGQVLAIVQIGGGLVLPGGRILKHTSRGLGDPLQVNGRYLFFLSAAPKGNCYYLSKAWALQGGHAIAIAADDKARAVNGTSLYNGMDEASFLRIASTLKASYHP